MTTLLRLPVVIEKTGLSRSSIYAKLEKGEFPKPVKLGERAIAWRDNEIADWISNRPDARV